MSRLSLTVSSALVRASSVAYYNYNNRWQAPVPSTGGPAGRLTPRTIAPQPEPLARRWHAGWESITCLVIILTVDSWCDVSEPVASLCTARLGLYMSLPSRGSASSSSHPNKGQRVGEPPSSEPKKHTTLHSKLPSSLHLAPPGGHPYSYTRPHSISSTSTSASMNIRSMQCGEVFLKNGME